VGEVSVVAFPLITMVLGLFYELDNTPSSDKPEAPGGKGKQDAAGKVRVSGEVESTEELDESLELPPPSQQAKQRSGRRLASPAR
jgi:hypothetical protein